MISILTLAFCAALVPQNAAAVHDFTAEFTPAADSLAVAGRTITLDYSLGLGANNVDTIIVYVPLTAAGANIYRVSVVTLTPPIGKTWVALAGPTGPDGWPDYFSLTAATPADQLAAGEVLTSNMVIDNTVASGVYDWTVFSRDVTLQGRTKMAEHQVDNIAPMILTKLPVNMTAFGEDPINLSVVATDNLADPDELSMFATVTGSDMMDSFEPLPAFPDYPYPSPPAGQLLYGPGDWTWDAADGQWQLTVPFAAWEDVDGINDGQYEAYLWVRVWVSDLTYDPMALDESNWATEDEMFIGDNVMHPIVITEINGAPPLAMYRTDEFEVEWDWAGTADPFFTEYNDSVWFTTPSPDEKVHTNEVVPPMDTFTIDEIGSYLIEVRYSDAANYWTISPATHAFTVEAFVKLYLNGVRTTSGDPWTWLYIRQNTPVNVTAVTVGRQYSGDLRVNLTLVYYFPYDWDYDGFSDDIDTIVSDVAMAFVDTIRAEKLQWYYDVPASSNLARGRYDVLVEWVEWDDISEEYDPIADADGIYAVYADVVGDVMLLDDIYRQCDKATFVATLSDFLGHRLSGAEIDLMAYDPNDYPLVDLLAWTNSNGQVVPFTSEQYYGTGLFGFSVGNDWPAGMYMWSGWITYVDTIDDWSMLGGVTYSVWESRSGNFEITAFDAAGAGEIDAAKDEVMDTLSIMSAQLTTIQTDLTGAIAGVADMLSALDVKLLGQPGEDYATLGQWEPGVLQTTFGILRDKLGVVGINVDEIRSTTSDNAAELEGIAAGLSALTSYIGDVYDALVQSIAAVPDQITPVISNKIDASHASLSAAISGSTAGIDDIVGEWATWIQGSVKQTVELETQTLADTIEKSSTDTSAILLAISVLLVVTLLLAAIAATRVSRS